VHRSLTTLALLAFTACAQDAPNQDQPADSSPSLPTRPNEPLGPAGSDHALDILTWNLERFPKRGSETQQPLTTVLSAIQPDIVAVQEIVDASALFEVADAMPGWKADVASFFDPSGPYNPPVGMLWNSTTIHVRQRYLLFDNEDHLAFPRAPLVLEFTWKNIDFVVINVHLKALGDNVIQHDDPNDEEVRRLRACERLEHHIRLHLPHARVIVVGDFNDRIEEPPQTNVFSPFLERPAEYLFADMSIATDPDAVVSYPRYTSHIDHVLITNELFAATWHPDSFTRTIPVDRVFMTSWGHYASVLSDHRPVLYHLDGSSD